MKYQGLYTAIVTPFKDGKVDYDAYKALIEAQIAGGVDGIVPMGTTGESPTVSTEEHLEIIRKCVEFVAGRCQVIAGTGANCTAEAIFTSCTPFLYALSSSECVLCQYLSRYSQLSPARAVIALIVSWVPI